MAQLSQTRTIRGYAIIAKGDEPKRISEGVYEIRSQSGSGFYRLTKHNTGWACSCPDYVNRHEAVGDCKHVSALRLWLEAKEETEKTDLFEQPKTVLTFEHCRFCNSIDLLVGAIARHETERHPYSNVEHAVNGSWLMKDF